MLVMARIAGTVLGQAQDHRTQPAGGLHLEGRRVWVSDPVDGCRHDTAAVRESGILDGTEPLDLIGDKGYIGRIADLDTHPEARSSRASRVGETIQYGNQQDQICHRTINRQPEDVANPAHRLPETTRYVLRDHRDSNRPRILSGQF